VKQRVFFVVAIAAFGHAIRDRLEQADLLRTVGTAIEPDDGLRQIERLGYAVDIVVVDAGLGGGLEIARDLRARRPSVRIVALGIDDEPRIALMWAKLGAAALVSRTASLDEVVDTLVAVARGESPCSPKVAAALLRGISGSRDGEAHEDGNESLTSREHEIALLLTDGLTNKEIAWRLHIEPGTVKNHVHSVIHKLGVSRRAQVAAALRRNFREQRAGV